MVLWNVDHLSQALCYNTGNLTIKERIYSIKHAILIIHQQYGLVKAVAITPGITNILLLFVMNILIDMVKYIQQIQSLEKYLNHYQIKQKRFSMVWTKRETPKWFNAI